MEARAGYRLGDGTVTVSIANGWLTVDTPDKDIWSDVSNRVRIRDIASIRCTHQPPGTRGHEGPNAAVEINGYKDAFPRVWVRCPSNEESRKLYDLICEMLDDCPDYR